MIRLDPHPAMHYPPTLGSLRVPTGRLVLPSRGNATFWKTCSERDKMITRQREEWK